MQLTFFYDVSLQVIYQNFTGCCSHVNRLIEWAPYCMVKSLIFLAIDLQNHLCWFVFFLAQNLLEVKHSNGGNFLVVRKRENFFFSERKRHLLELHRLLIGDVDFGHSLSILDIKDDKSQGCRGCNKVLAVLCHIN